MTKTPTVKLSVGIATKTKNDEFYMFLADDVSFQILTKLIPLLPINLFKMLSLETKKYLEECLNINDIEIIGRTLSYYMGEARIQTHQKLIKNTKNIKEALMPRDISLQILEDFSNWLYNTITNSSLFVYVNSGLFNLEFVQFDIENKYLVDAWKGWYPDIDGVFAPATLMFQDAFQDKKW